MRYLFTLLVVVVCFGAVAQDGPKRPDIPGEVMVDVGLNFLDAEPSSIDQKGWTSKSIGLYYAKRKALSGKLSLYYGAGLGMEKLSLGDTTTLSSAVFVDHDNNTGTPTILQDVAITSLRTDIGFDKNRLSMTYLDIPVDFRFHPKGTQDGEGLFIGVGGIVGLRLNSKVKYKYEENGETVREKISGEYNLNAFRYGYQVRLGFKGVHFFYKAYLSDVFKDELGGENPRMHTFGINLTGF